LHNILSVILEYSSITFLYNIPRGIARMLNKACCTFIQHWHTCEKVENASIRNGCACIL